MKVRFYALIPIVLAGLVGCSSSGTYFELEELRTVLRERRPASQLVAAYGTPQARFPETVFTAETNQPDEESEFYVEAVADDMIVTDIAGAGQEDMRYDDSDPWAHARLEASDPPRQAALRMQAKAAPPGLQQGETASVHYGELFESDFCETRTASLKYHAQRQDLNGYTEHQFTLFYIDASQSVCGFLTRSVFRAMR